MNVLLKCHLLPPPGGNASPGTCPRGKSGQEGAASQHPQSTELWPLGGKLWGLGQSPPSAQMAGRPQGRPRPVPPVCAYLFIGAEYQTLQVKNTSV